MVSIDAFARGGRFLLSLSLAFLLFGSSGEASPPKSKYYRSLSGGYSLAIGPNDIGGAGTEYRLTKNEEEVWSNKLPFPLWDAAVTETGVVAGYAYTLGLEGFEQGEPRYKELKSRRRLKGDLEEGRGDFVVIIIDNRGKRLLTEVTKRRSSSFLHEPPNPVAAGLFVDAPNDRVVVRVADPDANRMIEAWWIYRLSTGNPLAKIEPKKLMPDFKPARFIIDAKPVAGTPLTLVHWWRYEGESLGARFTLVDAQGKPVWLMEWRNDYNIAGDKEAQDKLMNLIRKRGAILDTTQDKGFDLFSAAKSTRVSFAVKNEPSKGWVVSEIAQVPFAIFPERTD